MTQKALLVIDVQVALFTLKDASLFNEKEVLTNIKYLLEKARKEKIPVIYVQHTSSEGLFAEKTPTWEFHSEIKPLEGEEIVQKRSWDGFYNTELDNTLKSLNVTELITVGMQSQFCVDTTCRRAYSMGYKNTLVSDAHTTFDTPVITGEQIVNHQNLTIGGRFASLSETKDIQF